MAFQYQNAWYAIKAKLENDRTDLVEQLIEQQDELSTVHLRGRIAMIDEILARYPSELSENESDDE